jgi:hypothetical protein
MRHHGFLTCKQSAFVRHTLDLSPSSIILPLRYSHDSMPSSNEQHLALRCIAHRKMCRSIVLKPSRSAFLSALPLAIESSSGVLAIVDCARHCPAASMLLALNDNGDRRGIGRKAAFVCIAARMSTLTHPLLN